MLVNRRTLRIEWGQCDPAGIVFYPQYWIMFDTSSSASSVAVVISLTTCSLQSLRF